MVDDYEYPFQMTAGQARPKDYIDYKFLSTKSSSLDAEWDIPVKRTGKTRQEVAEEFKIDDWLAIDAVVQAKYDFDDYKFSDKKATVFTFAREQATAILEKPKIMCVIDFEGGGRMQTELTDRDPDEVKLGMPVEMTFRKLQELKGIHHYFWKCKPVR